MKKNTYIRVKVNRIWKENYFYQWVSPNEINTSPYGYTEIDEANNIGKEKWETRLSQEIKQVMFKWLP